MHKNFEFKARCEKPERIRDILGSLGADYRGKDHQVDVYFNVPKGRLKLRKGNIENCLIGYEREDYQGAKESKVCLLPVEPKDSSRLEQILTATLGVKVIVDKKREIYFIGNVKFHLDFVNGLGSFVEVEAIDFEGDIGREELQRQCEHYKTLFGIKNEDMISQSYSDLLLRRE